MPRLSPSEPLASLGVSSVLWQDFAQEASLSKGKAKLACHFHLKMTT